MAEVPDWMRMIVDVAAGQVALDVGLCGRCLSRPIWREYVCFECDQWYCFNCGNDLPCPTHRDGTCPCPSCGGDAGGSMGE